MRGSCKLLCLALMAVMAVGFCATGSMAAGFALYEWSNEGDAMGGATVGSTNNATAVIHNPAGITKLKSWDVIAGVIPIMPKGKVTTTNMYDGRKVTTDQEENTHLIPHIYAAGPLGGDWYFGIGEFSRFGLASEFNKTWTGRYNSYLADIQTFSINPNLAVKLSDTVSIAFGVEIMMFDLELKQIIDGTKVLLAGGAGPMLQAQGIPTNINDPNTNLLDVDSKHQGDSTGIGFDVALQWTPTEQWGFGVVYRSEVTHNLTGRVNFDRIGALTGMLPGYIFQDGDISGSVTLPAMTSVGANFKPLKNLEIGAAVIYTQWSSYDALTIDYTSLTSVGSPSITKKKDWDDVFRYSIGLRWGVTPSFDLMFSYIYDESPVNQAYVDYLLPTNDRNVFGIGGQWRFGGGFRLDFSYNYLVQDDRSYDENRQIADGVMMGDATDGIAHIFGLSLGYTF